MTAPRYAVNCSILLKDLPVPERLAAVRQAGIDAVEFWWPFASVVPDDAEVDAFVGQIRDSGLRLIGLNLFAGDMPAGDRGIVSWPGRDAELAANLDVVVAIGDALGCRAFNALYGNRQPGASPDGQDELAARNIAAAADALAGIGGVVLLEPVSGVPAYPLKAADDVVRVIDRVAAESGATNVGLLMDVYHLAVNGDDVPTAIARHRSRIAHVQIADAPGRGSPGTGELPLPEWTDDLIGGGYEGWFALEYLSDAADPFAWMTEGT
jgi:hydroxypyruvate isomerase